jgi:hypothetical protein
MFLLLILWQFNITMENEFGESPYLLMNPDFCLQAHVDLQTLRSNMQALHDKEVALLKAPKRAELGLVLVTAGWCS